MNCTDSGVFCLSPQSFHITLMLALLHWLRVRFRCEFKFPVTTFKALHSLALPCINKLQITSRPQGHQNKGSWLCPTQSSRFVSWLLHYGPSLGLQSANVVLIPISKSIYSLYTYLYLFILARWPSGQITVKAAKKQTLYRLVLKQILAERELLT